MPGPEDRAGAAEAQTWAAPVGVDAQKGGAGAGTTLGDGQLFGSYRIVRMLGRGGMGEVYEAEHLPSGRRVALKLLRRELNDSDRARFLREGQLAAAISHRHTVYVYGTEEIDGVPVISMELATSGTLHDLVQQHGPTEPAKAVELTLQVVFGLASAARLGILHRDVKPHNCFLDPAAGVKVGDFGLSVGSGAQTDETQLTIAGTILGTPAYAAPEQLRGERVDVRADIYSVGATLFYLLTGKAPFEGGNLVQVLSRVMQETPPSVRTIRSGVPSRVARVVARCLAKNAADRYQTYEDLEHALERCTSGVAVAATLGRRTVAGVLDLLLLSLLSAAAWALLSRGDLFERLDRATLGQDILAILLAAVYFTGFEGALGASPAKKVLGLRVVGADGLRATWRAVFVRAAVFVLTVKGTALAWRLVVGWASGGRNIVTLGSLILFSVARGDNGWAGLHDRLSKTRAVRRGRLRRGESVNLAGEMPAGSASAIERSACREVGQFLVQADQVWQPDTTVLGFDPALARPVWIRPAAAGTPPVGSVRRDLARTARLRWLAGERGPELAWDAYEASDGCALLDPQLGSVPWDVVRGWLMALTEEIETAAREPDRSELLLDRVWVASNGSVKLLDWPSGGGVSEGPELEPQAFLAQVAKLALGATRRAGDTRDASPAPRHVWRFLERLASARVPTLERVRAQIRELGALPTKVTRLRRGLHVALAGLIPFVALSVSLISLVQILRLPLDQREHLLVMQALFAESQRADSARASQAELLLADRYQRLSDAAARQLDDVGSSRLRKTAAAHRGADRQKVAGAEASLAGQISRGRAQASSWSWPVRHVATGVFDASVVVGWIAVVAAFALRGGLALGAMGMALMSRRGGRAALWRAGWRGLVAWAPILVPQLVLFVLSKMGFAPGEPVTGLLHVVAVLVLLAGGIIAVMRPTDSVQDQIAGTFVVRR
jgi:eukaryotic-like serine/threonine-protein kinase